MRRTTSGILNYDGKPGVNYGYGFGAQQRIGRHGFGAAGSKTARRRRCQFRYAAPSSRLELKVTNHYAFVKSLTLGVSETIVAIWSDAVPWSQYFWSGVSDTQVAFFNTGTVMRLRRLNKSSESGNVISVLSASRGLQANDGDLGRTAAQ